MIPPKSSDSSFLYFGTGKTVALLFSASTTLSRKAVYYLDVIGSSNFSTENTIIVNTNGNNKYQLPIASDQSMKKYQG